MLSGGTRRGAVAAAGLVVALIVNPAPAEAGPRGWRGAVAAGLIGSIAIGMMAAAADAQAAQNAGAYAALPDDELLEETTIRLPSPPRQARPARRTIAGKKVSPPISSTVLKACRDYLTSASRPHGSVRVEAKGAGPAVESRGGAIHAPIKTTITYSRDGRSQSRTAKVTCHIDGNGRAVAVRSLRGARQAIVSR
jgi:hypothetical protein